MKRLLVVDPDPGLRADLLRVARAAGYTARAVADEVAALGALAEEGGDVVLLDVAAGGLDSLDALRRAAPGVGLVAMGASPAVEGVVEALRRGAQDFLRKPFGVGELERALAAVTRCRGALAGSSGLLTEDPGMRRLLEKARHAALTEATVRIVGESGTGKEILARRIHQESARRSGPLVLVNCAGLHESLAESELFGHERGAFTGAVESRLGQIAAASGGTLVLDEVSDLAAALQPKLLRVLQEREVTPLGASRPRPVDLRIVVTTQRDLAAEVAEGRFREDLYYRLDVITLRVPALRERPGDVALLARRFLARFAHEAGCEPPQLGDEVLAALARQPLRGNVRELENLMRRAVVLFPGRQVELQRLLSPRAVAAEPLPEGLRALNLRDLERAAVARSLVVAEGNRTLASRVLGISVRTLRNKIRLYDLA